MSLEYLTGIESYYDRLIQRRRELHQNPEPSFHEFETIQYIEAFLSTLEHAELLKPTQTSVIAKFTPQKSKFKLGLRADIDALPIHEELTNISYISQNMGYMHACGHDGHTAMLMTACEWFNQHFDLLENDIYCIFQHAEELPPGGGKAIMDSGLIDDLDFIYGQHLNPELELGYLDVKEGPVTSNSDDYKIIINGIGGHSSKPSLSINPINIASRIIQAFNEIPAQEIDSQESAVISNTYIQAGNSIQLNIIPDSLTLGGSVRTFDKETAEYIEERLKTILEGICSYYGASFQYTYNRGARSVYNPPHISQKIKAIASQVQTDKVVSLKEAMFGEDFSAFSQHIPATFVMLGSRGGEDTSYPLHHPKFNIDEQSLMVGLKMLIAVALEYHINEYKD